MKLFFLTAWLTLSVAYSSFGQDLSLKWSDLMVYKNKYDGFFHEIIGSNEETVYARFSNLYGSTSVLKIVAFDKNTLAKKASVPIRGYKENNGAEYKGLDFSSVDVLNEQIYVFWTKLTNTKKEKKEELFVEVFDMDLNRKEDLKQIFTVELNTDRKISSSASFITIVSNKKFGDDIVVGYEEQNEGEPIKFHYSVVSSDLEVGDMQTVELPIEAKGKKAYGVSSVYHLGEDGNIYASSTATIPKEDRKNLPKGTSYMYSVFTVINTETNDIESLELRADKINFNDFIYKIINGKIKIYGFFCDLEKDPKGNSSHGIYHVEMDSKTLETSSIEYNYFDKSFVDELFKEDKEDKKKTGLTKKARERNANNDQQSLDTRFIIEKIFVGEDESVVLFCSKMYNYSVTTCTSSPNGGQTCTTRYYCQKSNVTAIKLNKEDEIVWASNLDRLITYSGWDKFDLNVVKNGDSFYAIYGSAFVADASKKSGKKSKSRSDARDSFEYAVFNDNTGKYDKNNFQINAKGTEKKDIKLVNPLMITEVDGDFYVQHIKVKPMSYLCCGPILMFAPGAVKADGYLGKISIIDGGGSKKKRR